LYEPCEGEEIGEENDGAMSIGRGAIFSVIVNGKEAELGYYLPEDLPGLSQGDELDILGSSKKKIHAVFLRYVTVISDGIIEIRVPEEEGGE
jgi:hypothetical protein